jgi:hypothetical protein
MSGLPLNVNDENFEKIIILLSGIGNIGKSTTSNIIANNDHIKLIQCDIMCHEFFQDPLDMYNKTKFLSTQEKQKLYHYVYGKIIDGIHLSTQKVYLIEGYIISFMMDGFNIEKKLSENFKYIWNMTKAN